VVVTSTYTVNSGSQSYSQVAFNVDIIQPQVGRAQMMACDIKQAEPHSSSDPPDKLVQEIYVVGNFFFMNICG